jgi:hypothetical protein
MDSVCDARLCSRMINFEPRYGPGDGLIPRLQAVQAVPELG